MARETMLLDTLASSVRGEVTTEAAMSQYDVDNAELTRLGKKPVLKVLATFGKIFIMI